MCLQRRVRDNAVGDGEYSMPRVRTGHGNLEKSWNSEIKIPGLEKSWNLKYYLKSWKGHGISNKSLKKVLFS